LSDAEIAEQVLGNERGEQNECEGRHDSTIPGPRCRQAAPDRLLSIRSGTQCLKRCLAST
jgi:hypothetical protein